MLLMSSSAVNKSISALARSVAFLDESHTALVFSGAAEQFGKEYANWAVTGKLSAVAVAMNARSRFRGTVDIFPTCSSPQSMQPKEGSDTYSGREGVPSELSWFTTLRLPETLLCHKSMIMRNLLGRENIAQSEVTEVRNDHGVSALTNADGAKQKPSSMAKFRGFSMTSRRPTSITFL